MSDGVMIVRSNFIGEVTSLSKRAIKNKEYAEIGGATLRELGLSTQYMPEYLLEEVGRGVKSGVGMSDVGYFFKNSGKSNREIVTYMKAIRTKENPTEEDLTHTFKATVSNAVWEYLKASADDKGISISKLIEIQALFIAETEVTSK